jgi:hypothetical protein
MNLLLTAYVYTMYAGASSDSLVAAQLPATAAALPLGTMPQYAVRRKVSMCLYKLLYTVQVVATWVR